MEKVRTKKKWGQGNTTLLNRCVIGSPGEHSLFPTEWGTKKLRTHGSRVNLLRGVSIAHWAENWVFSPDKGFRTASWIEKHPPRLYYNTLDRFGEKGEGQALATRPKSIRGVNAWALRMAGERNFTP